MKKIDLYQCEICGTQFKSKEDCVKCEKGHQKELHIVKTRYLPYTGREWNAHDDYACWARWQALHIQTVREALKDGSTTD